MITQYLRNRRGVLTPTTDVPLPDPPLPPCTDPDCNAPRCGDACTTAERDHE